MTQALLNNLNISIEKTVNITDKLPKTEGLDFGRIFESKTNNFAQTTKTASLKSDKSETVTQKTNNIQTAKENSAADNTADTVNDLKTSTDTNNVNLETDTNNVQDNSVDNTADTSTVMIINAEEDTSSNNTDTSNTDIYNTQEIENAIAENIINTIEESIITEEEPTMYNELNTLEDPATILLLQAQIQKNIKNCMENEQIDDLSDENISFKSNDNTLNNNTVLCKQFENVISKDVNTSQTAQIFTSKELVQTKNQNTKVSDVINENIVKELNVEVVSAQSAEAETSFGDLMQNQSPQEQAARVMIQGDIKYEQTAAETIKNTQVKTTTITPSKIIEQITKQLDGMVNNSKLNMVLNPGSLGKVNLQLMNTKDGLTAQFTVTTQDVKDILMKGLDGLKESLLAQGVNVDNISIKLEEAENDYKQDYTEQEGSKGGNKQQGYKQNKEKEQSFQDVFEMEYTGVDKEETAEV